MQNSSYTQKLLEERDELMRFICAKEDGKPCWFYLRLDSEKLKEYEAKMKTGDLDIRDYGVILESDWGHYPPSDVVRFMLDEYGFITPPELPQ